MTLKLCFGAFALRNVKERDDDSVDPVLGRPVRQYPHQEVTVVQRAHFLFYCVQRFEYGFGVVRKIDTFQTARNIRQRPAKIRCDKIEQVTSGRREKLDTKTAIE